eukprot:TRINITY_DN10793_c0_g1_i1.p1 TRINITY_DN10793_c0_g1~~TRINITY_DN10793_c0_g1_i1.p1  ORF type:complete len:308 (-),score=49.16 TRINITY_DN10793_c0_g1_i1:46-969(-)
MHHIQSHFTDCSFILKNFMIIPHHDRVYDHEWLLYPGVPVMDWHCFSESVLTWIGNYLVNGFHVQSEALDISVNLCVLDYIGDLDDIIYYTYSTHLFQFLSIGFYGCHQALIVNQNMRRNLNLLEPSTRGYTCEKINNDVHLIPRSDIESDIAYDCTKILMNIFVVETATNLPLDIYWCKLLYQEALFQAQLLYESAWCGSIGGAYATLRETAISRKFALRQLDIAKHLNDTNMELRARIYLEISNISEGSFDEAEKSLGIISGEVERRMINDEYHKKELTGLIGYSFRLMREKKYLIENNITDILT